MKAHGRRRRRAGPAGAAPRRRRGRAGPRTLAAVLVVAAALTGWWLLRSSAVRTRAGAPAGALASMDPASAYRAAISLVGQTREPEALPYFRRALEATRENFWELYFNCASALYNITIAYQTRAGLAAPLTRSSFERAALMRQVMVELGRAEHLARSPADLATMKSYRGPMMNAWGFPWETSVAWREAQYADRGRRDLALQADAYMDYMQATGEPRSAPSTSGEDPGR